jgi:hypothetical protein
VQGERSAKLLAVLCGLLLACILLFRAFGYSHLPIAPGEPTGISDLIELALGSALLVVLVISAGMALSLGIKGPRQNRMAAVWLGMVVLLIAALAGPLHTFVARWASA